MPRSVRHLLQGLAAVSIVVPLLGATPVDAAEPPANAVRVMTFNIRYGTANDGENRWDVRKEFVVETIEAFDPDLLGTQETVLFQREFLEKNLDGYEAFGAGREDGKDAGEQTTLFYKSDRFERLDGGHFWLSETPETPGSKSWDSSLPRVASWVKLKDRQAEGAAPILFLNTHFDHRGAEARLRSAQLVRKKVAEICADCRAIVTGDFNAGEGSPPYQALFGAVDGEPSPLRDVYRLAHPERRDDEGTFSSFVAGARQGGRIDWIAASSAFEPLAATIDRTERDGRTPSDHFPVTATLAPAGDDSPSQDR